MSISKNKMNFEHGWTKEMIDEIKNCEIDSILPILIKIQSTHYKFTDEEYNFFGDAEKTSQSYEGIFDRGAYCMDDLDGEYDEEKYKIWKRVYISIQFYDHNTRKFKELNSEGYKYGYLAFWNQKIDVISPALTIGLNKDCGVKEKIDDLFIKYKIFNHKELRMDIEYDCEFVKDIEYDNFLTDKIHSNLVPVKSIDLGARFGLD